MSTKIIGTMISRITLLPEQFHEKIRELLLSAQFRSYETLTQQIDSLHEEGQLSFEYNAIIINLNKSYVYRNSGQKIQKTMQFKKEKAMYSPNSALAINEEQEILNLIKRCHEASNCPSPIKYMPPTNVYHKRKCYFSFKMYK